MCEQLVRSVLQLFQAMMSTLSWTDFECGAWAYGRALCNFRLWRASRRAGGQAVELFMRVAWFLGSSAQLDQNSLIVVQPWHVCVSYVLLLDSKLFCICICLVFQFYLSIFHLYLSRSKCWCIVGHGEYCVMWWSIGSYLRIFDYICVMGTVGV